VPVWQAASVPDGRWPIPKKRRSLSGASVCF